MESAKNAWKIHRWSTILLMPLIIYLFYKVYEFTRLSYDGILEDLSSSRSIGLILIFTILGLIHMKVGVNEILEDYVHDGFYRKLFQTLIFAFFLFILIFVCLSLLLILLS
tara:strand:- start:1964 stop:2296 length:333 start_codon:yes stop_codon:yes gene_type:complete